MSLSEELARLETLFRSGGLNEQEFNAAKARVIADAECRAPLRLRRSRDDRWIAGVCGGFAKATGTESWMWRLLLVLLFLVGGAGVVLYVLLWIFEPEE
ncbi:MAG: PspC domain-containing protein [Pseudomonadota bacterium]|nr:PspC domain-containing protein [Pseudomonadota bacterium]